MADMRKCIGSARFGIEAHEAPVGDFPSQPSQKDGLGRMCKPHWNQYTAKGRAGAQGRRRRSLPSGGRRERRGPGQQGRRPEGQGGQGGEARADPDEAGAGTQDGRRSDRRGGRRRHRARRGRRRGGQHRVDLPAAAPRALGANPGPFSVGWRQWPCARSSRHVGQPWRPWANVAGACIGDHRDYSRNSAVRVHMGGAVFHEGGTRVWVPPVGPRGTLGRVARSTEHGQVAGVERVPPAASGTT